MKTNLVSFDLLRKVCSVLTLETGDQPNLPERWPYQELDGEESDVERSTPDPRKPSLLPVGESDDEDPGLDLDMDDFVGYEQSMEDCMDEGQSAPVCLLLIWAQFKKIDRFGSVRRHR